MRPSRLFSMALLALAACATTSLPPDRLASSSSAISAADELGAKKLPQAALHLKLAQEELAQAQQLAKDGDAARAELLLQRSTADAELAVALVRVADAKSNAAKAATAVLIIEGKTP